MNIIIGQLIKQKVKEQNLSVTEFAQMINCSRTNVYSIYKRKKIDRELLKKISKALKYNFAVQHFDNEENDKQYLIVAHLNEKDLNNFVEKHNPALCWAVS